MFERHRLKEARKRYDQQLAAWQEQRDEYADLLQLAQTFGGESDPGLMLKPDEAVFGKVAGCSLVEERRGPGHWQGAYSGFSVPIGTIGGHPVRYHVGGTRGHYVQGTPLPTAIDSGTVIVTNRRVIFQGTRQTRECLYDKLIGFQHSEDGSTTLSVSNREKPITLHYGPKLAGWFDFRLDLALAQYRNDVPQLVERLQHDLAEIDDRRPAPPDAT
jgi:hypothetical protein